MHPLTASIFAGLILLMCVDATPLPTNVTIMSFNVRTSLANDPCPCGCWKERQHIVKEQVNRYDPDMFGLQETSHEQKATFDSLFAGIYSSVGQDSGSYQGRAGEINAIYYKTNSWSLLSNSMVWLGPDPSRPSAAWGMQYYRTAVYGRFRHKTKHQSVCVFNTHYETPGNDLAQVEGAKVILTTANQVCEKNDVIFVLGDMNATPQSSVMQFMYSNPPIPLQKTSFNGQGTWCNNMFDPISKCTEEFDHVLYHTKNNQTSLCVLESKPVREEINKCHVSDHALLLTKVEINPNRICHTERPVPKGSCGMPEFNIEYRGVTVASMKCKTHEECCTLCETERSCNAYTWLNGVCSMKATRGGAVKALGSTSARVIKCSTPELNVDYIGKDIQSFSTFLVADCCAMCRQVSGCRAYTWAGNKCYLKSGKGETIALNGAYSGVVKE